MKTASWVIVNQAGEALFETFNPKIAAQINKDKYSAIPIGEYLPSLNGIPILTRKNVWVYDRDVA